MHGRRRAARFTWVPVVLRFVGLLPPPKTHGRGLYYAGHGAAAFALAVIVILSGYGLTYAGSLGMLPIAQALLATLAACAYVIALRSLIGFWSVPTAERRAEFSDMRASAHGRRILTLSWTVSGFAVVALVVLIVIGRR